MSDMVSKRWRAGIYKDCSLQKAHMLCSLHTHLSCPAVSHCIRFRPCRLIPNACLDATFQICLRNRAHLCVQSGAACDSTVFHGLLHFASANSCAGAGAGTPDKIQSVLLFLKTLNPFQVSKRIIYARSAPLSCTGWVDRAGCGPD